jgi:hypothetical protein
MQHEANRNLDRQVMAELQDMLYRLHPAVQLYKQAYEITRELPNHQQCRIALRYDKECDQRRYNLPTAASNEIAVILPGDGDEVQGSRDIVLYRRNGQGLQRISDLHPLYQALHYVLLFPTGQFGWSPNIPYAIRENDAVAYDDDDGDRPDGKRSSVTQTEYFRYRLFPRINESSHIFMSEKLLQEWIVDSWALSEQARLRWIKLNQPQLRSESRRGLMDAVAVDPNATGEDVGQRTILPSSFAGSTRNMIQNCQDALAINRYYGGADLFITATADPNWPEIKDALLPGQKSSDRPDLIVRVFRAKMVAMIQDICKKGVMGRTIARVYTIEFQKRGLPHMHMIIFLHPDSKLKTPEDVDSLISAEFPDKGTEPELFDLVKKYMVHTPCTGNPDSPCIKDPNAGCSKSFPKPFREQTIINEDSYSVLRRRDTGTQYEHGQHMVDNRWVVPRCHINVECISSIKAIKYIYKYVYKGHDRTTMEFGNCEDEVKLYLDARYVSACEGCWRLYHFWMHEEKPAIIRLQVHTEDEQLVTWNNEVAGNLQQVLENQGARDTTLTAYFKANQEYPEARDLLYQDFPSKFVWKKTPRKWAPRQRDFAIGRMYYCHPTSGERFYVRTLLAAIKGATSFQDLQTVPGMAEPCATFHEACLRRGLLEDDNEWRQCLQEAGDMATGRQLRDLFATLLRDCTPSDPLGLWMDFRDKICDDLRHRLESHRIRQNPTPEDVYDFGLYLIEEILQRSNKSLRNWPMLPLPQQNWDDAMGNRLIAEQRDYNQEEQAQHAEDRIPRLNQEQQSAFDKIVEAVENKTGQTFFLHGPGGTGKTYVYNTLCYFLRGRGIIVLCVASSGIAALLLIGGRTAHSFFKIPINIHESSLCGIKKNSLLAALIKAADLVIWDEAPMQSRHIHEAVDRTFQDVRSSDRPFGGLCVVFGGDFKQILPVIIKGNRAQIVGISMQRSTLWHSIQILRLTQNMRLNTADEQEREFAQWQLDVGHGRHTDENGNITLPDRFHCTSNTIESLIDTIYPGITFHIPPTDQYFAERTILASRNDDVDSINANILGQFTGEIQTFLSADSIKNNNGEGGQGVLMYPVEYLNSINCSGLPLHKLELKKGCPVMVLRNLNPEGGVCNGSRGVLTRYRNRVLEIRLITGQHAGSTVFIPRIGITPAETQIPFEFCRRQFPIRLCFAMTINKSQGQSVAHVGLDLRSSVFTHGQFYVAISRVTSVHRLKAIWDSRLPTATTKNIVYPEVIID